PTNTGGPNQAAATITLTEGLHDITIEYLHDTGPATLALAWDLAGSGTPNALIPASALLRTDATLTDPTAHGLDDLLVTDATGARIIDGRANAEWTDLDASAVTPFVTGSWSAAGVGDVNGDGRNDIALVRSGELRIYGGGGLPSLLEKKNTITGLPANVA